MLQASNTLKETYRTHPELNPGGFKTASAKNCKYGYYKGIYCDSSWELAFVVYCRDNNINIKRNKQGFNYILFNGIEHLYYPDFNIDNVYYEIKGIYTEQDIAKIQQFKEDLVVIDKSNINKYLDYAITTYGKNFPEILYDKSKPNFTDNSGKINMKIFMEEN